MPFSLTMAASITIRPEEDRALLCPSGRWEIANAAQLDRLLRELSLPDRRVTIDLDGIEAMDTAGAWLLVRTLKRLEAQGLVADFSGGKAAYHLLLDQLEAAAQAPEAPAAVSPLADWFVRIGTATAVFSAGIVGFLLFLGQVVTTLGRIVIQPRRLRVTAIINHIETTGVTALPIIGLVSFLIGVVLAYQAEVELRRYGATSAVIYITATAIMREFGVLLTAIMVAGRSGSAFTAEIGTMVVGEEVDALRTLGLDPIEILVIPRLIALVVAVPLLSFFADILGLLGSSLLSWVAIGLSPALYIHQLGEISITHFWVGMVKAPVFAVIIALIGCYEGLRAAGSAESVGRQTTRSVVEAVFVVIVLDALFSVFFDVLGI